ncbi:MAG: S-layer homology domain-containing protein [bacterium]|nr:S-layer homology domain-containing protein [bacterium]MYD03498.1 hypothetical protein [Acidimicrobiia bacterium]
MKKALFIAAALASLVSSSLAPPPVAAFDDVPVDGVHAPAIEGLDAEGVLKGTACLVGDVIDQQGPVELFCPHQPIKRWVLAVWLAKSLGVEIPDHSEPHGPFADVEVNRWWSPYVARLAQLGIINGCSRDPLRFCPDNNVTRGQMAAFLGRTYGLKESGKPSLFVDTVSNVHSVHIDALAEAGVIKGCSTLPALYCPEDFVSRAQSATLLWRARSLPTAPTFLVPADGRLEALEPPRVSARTWILFDETYERVLAEKDADERRSLASTTKIMTALVTLENASLDEKVSISATAAGVGYSEVGLVAGEDPWTVEQLLGGLMLRSGNDAAVALAEHLGGSVEGFSALMNAKVEALGLQNTSFANPHGLDATDHYTSARDLLAIARAAMALPTFEELVRAPEVVFPRGPRGENRANTNKNRLLTEYEGALGIKTGFTSKAGLTMAAAAERDGRRLYAVVLGSNGHYADVMRLFDYGFEAFEPVSLAPAQDQPRPLAA